MSPSYSLATESHHSVRSPPRGAGAVPSPGGQSVVTYSRRCPKALGALPIHSIPTSDDPAPSRPLRREGGTAGAVLATQFYKFPLVILRQPQFELELFVFFGTRHFALTEVRPGCGSSKT